MDSENSAAVAVATMRSPAAGLLSPKAPLFSPSAPPTRKPFAEQSVNKTAAKAAGAKSSLMSPSLSSPPLMMIGSSSKTPTAAVIRGTPGSSSLITLAPGSNSSATSGNRGARPATSTVKGAANASKSGVKAAPLSTGKKTAGETAVTPLPVSNRLLFSPEADVSAASVAFATPLNGAVGLLDAAEAEETKAREKDRRRMAKSFSIAGEEDEEEVEDDAKQGLAVGTPLAGASVAGSSSSFTPQLAVLGGDDDGAGSRRPLYNSADRTHQAWIASLLAGHLIESDDAARRSHAVLQAAAMETAATVMFSPSLQQADAAILRLRFVQQQQEIARELRDQEMAKEEEAEMVVDEEGQASMATLGLFAGTISSSSSNGSTSDADAEGQAAAHQTPNLVHFLRLVKPAAVRRGLQQALFAHLSNLQQSSQDSRD
jgi:hypothetical protein